MVTLPAIDALGTQFWIEISDDIDEKTQKSVSECVLLYLKTFEKNYSRFKADSLVSILNSTRQLENPSNEFKNLITRGLYYYNATNGIFNMLVGDTLLARGYDNQYSFKVSAEPTKSLDDPNHALLITDDCIILQSGSVDFGGFGKGVAIDAIAAILRDTYGLRYFLINGGGDIFCTSNHGKPFTIYLEHPTTSSTYLGTITVMNQGFAASSPHKRSWVYKDKSYSHIVNTIPDDSTATAKPDASFVIAQTAVTADVFATVALITNNETMDHFAHQNNLAVATYTLPTTFRQTENFNLQRI